MLNISFGEDPQLKVRVPVWGVSGLEKGARVQMTLSLVRGLVVVKEQGRRTKSPWTTSTLGSLMLTFTAAGRRETPG